MGRAGGTTAENISVRGERIVKDSMRLGVPWWHSRRSALLEVDEDLADAGWFVDVGDDAQLSAAMRAEGDVDAEDPLQSLCPKERYGGRVGHFSGSVIGGAAGPSDHPLRFWSCAGSVCSGRGR